MQILTFHTDEAYVRAQKRTQKLRQSGPYFLPTEMPSIVRWLRDNRDVDLATVRGICHGAMKGEEADELERLLPGSRIAATDLFPRARRVVRWDMRQPRRRWRGAFDLLYSNSLDHADRPWDCLRTWVGQLRRPSGVGFIQWSPSHVGVAGGDCFGAHLDEYVALVEAEARLLGLIYVAAGVTVLAFAPRLS